MLNNDELTPEQRDMCRAAYKKALFDSGCLYGTPRETRALQAFPDPIVYPRDSHGCEWRLDAGTGLIEGRAQCEKKWMDLEKGNWPATHELVDIWVSLKGANDGQ